MVGSFDEMSRMKCATVMWTRVSACGGPAASPQWSSRSTVCSSPEGAAVRVPGMRPHLQWNRVRLLAMSRYRLLIQLLCVCVGLVDDSPVWASRWTGIHSPVYSACRDFVSRTALIKYRLFAGGYFWSSKL